MKSKYFKPEDFDWFVRKQSSITGFTKELADYCNERIIDPEYDALIEEMVEASQNLLREFAIDWYCEMYAKSEKPTGMSTGIVAKIHNTKLNERIHIAITKLREASAKLEAFKGKK